MKLTIGMRKYDYFITGTIGKEYDWWTGERGITAKAVKEFLDKNKDKELNILVSSPGGYIDEGLTICELIAAHGNCNMYIVGMTASAATFLCMKAKTVNIATGSMMLIHNTSINVLEWCSANKKGLDTLIAKFQKQRNELDTFDKGIASIYSFRNKKSIEDNMKKMDEEKWMLPEEAKEFGIVDSIFDDEESKAAAVNFCTRAANKAGFTEHFGLPDIPVSKKDESFWSKLRKQLGGVVGLVENIAPIEDNNTNKTTSKMKKIVKNCMCAILGVTDLEATDDGKVTLTEEQLQKVEDGLKAKDTSIASITKERDEAKNALTAAETAKAQAEKDKKEAEDKLAQLQKDFDDYKKEAGDDSPTHVKTEPGDSPKNAKELLDDVRDLL